MKSKFPQVQFFCSEEIREGEAHKECKWSFFGKIVIKNPTDGKPYLTRYILARTPAFRIFLHKFHGPDPDRDVHNHPWRATSVILRGGYTELVDFPVTTAYPHWRAEILRKRFPGQVNHLREEEFHRIVSVKPNTWTLVFGGPYFREWGFMVDGLFVDWRTYLGVPSGTTLND